MLIYDATRATPLPSTDGIATVIMVDHADHGRGRRGGVPAVHARRARPRLGGRRRRRVRDVDGRSSRASIGTLGDPFREERGVAGGEVKLIDLVKQFGDVTAVDGINLEMPGAEFFSMLGPSGCGKTTTLRMIAGFEQPTSGQILLDGEDMAFTPPHKRNVNTVFQSYALFPHLTRAGQRRVRAAPSEGAQERDQAAGGRGAGAGAADRPRASQAGADVGRPAAARGAGPGAGAEAGGAAAGRAAGRAGREAAKGAADRAEGAAAAGRHHVHLRHARPGGGAHHERPDRRDERRPGRAGGAAVRGLRGAVDHLRGRLPGRLQPDAGDRARRQRRALPGDAGRLRAARIARRDAHHRRHADRDPARAGAPGAARVERREPRARHRRARRLPGQLEPDHRHPGQRRQGSGAGAEHRRGADLQAGRPGARLHAGRGAARADRHRHGADRRGRVAGGLTA